MPKAVAVRDDKTWYTYWQFIKYKEGQQFDVLGEYEEFYLVQHRLNGFTGAPFCIPKTDVNIIDDGQTESLLQQETRNQSRQST